MVNSIVALYGLTQKTKVMQKEYSSLEYPKVKMRKYLYEFFEEKN